MSRMFRICRKGFFRGAALAAVAVLTAAPFLVGNFRGSMGRPGGGPEPLTCSVRRGEFLHEILVKGEVESAVHTEVRCEVRSQHGAWVRILEIAAEGTHVEPGDFLVQLDSSTLEADRNQQQILCEQAAAEVAKAGSDYAAAETARRDYLRGDYVLDRQVAELGVFVSQERRRKAGQSLEASRKLEALGYVTAQQLRANQFGLQAAETDVRMAETKLQVLESCTKRRKLVQLQSAVAASKAQLAAAEAKYKLSCQLLADMEDQIRKCTVRAPVPGTVVLAHLFHNGHAHMIEPGETVYERRVMVRLPDYRHMQITAKIEEAKIAFVRPGLPATIRLEGFPEAELTGKVVTISEYPDADDWVGSAVKQYQTKVALECPLEGMRPGMTAELRIRVHRIDDQLQVPSQAVLHHGGKDYCISVDGECWEAHEILLGPSNGVTTVIRRGLEADQRVVLSPESYRERVLLPEAPEKAGLLAPGARSVPDRIAQAQ